MSHYALAIGVVRTLTVLTGASFAALLLRATLPVRDRLGAVEKWLAATLFIYSANVTAFTAVFLTSATTSRSLINVGFLASFLAGHRYLYFVRRDNRP
ncbi:hypothetical protein PV336_16155 [Streptomyces sp. MI02-2A]|uniref:hypothetical protein n=1 Tax=Streptomyces sp. MI02-2A TaxID=3028688 RepID=UPI0029B86191|nr:hypothetical protein [Streptomyces sp. MI02-2A]MDX3260754.1 hypothetical protein [Streptomyces sp. MI02-2A]